MSNIKRIAVAFAVIFCVVACLVVYKLIDNHFNSFSYILEQADYGNAEAQNKIGERCYFISLQSNNKQYYKEMSTYYYTLAAKQGNVNAQVQLAARFSMQGDYDKAFYYSKLAAEQNDVWGLENLGDMYYNGQGVKQDYNEALKYFILASKHADQASASPLRCIGDMYYHGHGVEKDLDKAFKYYTLAEEKIFGSSFDRLYQMDKEGYKPPQ